VHHLACKGDHFEPDHNIVELILIFSENFKRISMVTSVSKVEKYN
jgi:hypothetical protein